MRTRRLSSVAALTAVGILTLTGCGSDGPTEQPSPSATATASATQSAEPTTPAPTPTTEEPTEAPTTEPAPETTSPTAEPSSPTENPTSPPADDRAQVTPLVTYAGPSTDGSGTEVSGFVPDLVEGGGTCTTTLTPQAGGEPRQLSTEAEADASTTICFAVVFPSADLAPGTWDAVLTYESPTSAGSSAATTVEVG